mgnify:CR=1 FL=1
MHQTIREYALERLAERDGEEAAMRRLASYYLQLALAAEPNLTGPDQKRWLDRLEVELDNIRAALSWLIARKDALALKMVAALWYFWEIRGYLSEGRRWLEQALAHTAASPTPERARILHVSAGLALRQGDYERGRRLSRESLAISRDLGDSHDTGRALHVLGISEEALGNLDAAQECYLESIAIFRELGHRPNLARTLNSLGVLARARGDYDRAIALFNESLDLHATLGSKRSIALALANLGMVALLRERWDEAQTLFVESLGLREEIGHKVGIGDCLIGLGCVSVARGDALRAATLFGAGTRLFRTMDYEMEPSDRRVYERGLDAARACSAPEEFEAAWAEGEALDVANAIRFADEVTSDV